MKIIDTHCHLDAVVAQHNHANLDPILAKCHELLVDKIIHISLNVQQYYDVVEQYSKHQEIYFALGVHPSNAHLDPLELDRLRQAVAENKRVVAVGEIGLDDYRGDEHLAIQEEYFRKQLLLAKELNLPMIIHTRGTITTRLLDICEQLDYAKGVLHCFVGTKEEATRAVAMGFYIGVGGIATFKNAEEVREMLRSVPVSRILTETDAPYLAPTPHRGKLNQPAYTRHVVDYVAGIYGLTPEEFATVTYQNANDLFGLAD